MKNVTTMSEVEKILSDHIIVNTKNLSVIWNLQFRNGTHPRRANFEIRSKQNGKLITDFILTSNEFGEYEINNTACVNLCIGANYYLESNEAKIVSNLIDVAKFRYAIKNRESYTVLA